MTKYEIAILKDAFAGMVDNDEFFRAKMLQEIANALMYDWIRKNTKHECLIQCKFIRIDNDVTIHVKNCHGETLGLDDLERLDCAAHIGVKLEPFLKLLQV